MYYVFHPCYIRLIKVFGRGTYLSTIFSPSLNISTILGLQNLTNHNQLYRVVPSCTEILVSFQGLFITNFFIKSWVTMVMLCIHEYIQQITIFSINIPTNPYFFKIIVLKKVTGIAETFTLPSPS